MQKKPDFGSMILVIAFVIIITVVLYLAIVNIIDSYISGSADATLYSRPTWPDPTPVPTTEAAEETEVTEEPEEDEETEEE